jgi:PAS domain-containing protein
MAKTEKAPQLRVILEYARNIFDTIPLGLMVFDESGQCVSANKAAARLLDSPAEKLLSRNFRNRETWNSAGLLLAEEDTVATGRGHRLNSFFTPAFGATIRIENRLERFMAGGKGFLVHVMIDMPEPERAFHGKPFTADDFDYAGMRDLLD